MLNPRLYLGTCLATLLMSVECMGKQLTMAPNKHVSIVTYNAQGFQSGSVSVKELLNDCDILCLQEHGLLNEHLNDLNICDDFTVVGVSETFVRGRPFGGCAIFFCKSFSSLMSCHVSSRRFCALHFTMPDCLTLLLVCIYLPFNNGLYSGHSEFQETLDELWMSWKVLLIHKTMTCLLLLVISM